MKNTMLWVLFVALLAVGTAIVGWWVVPLLGALYGLAAADRAPWLGAGLAAIVAWTALLLVTSLQGPVLQLARQVGGVLALPGPVFIALTLGFAALLAGSAAELAASVRRLARRAPGRWEETIR
jgi:hypothetical protein